MTKVFNIIQEQRLKTEISIHSCTKMT